MSLSRSFYEQLMEWQSVHAAQAQTHEPAKLALPSDDVNNASYTEDDVSVERDESGCSPDWRERLAALRAIGEETATPVRFLARRTICRRRLAAERDNRSV